MSDKLGPMTFGKRNDHVFLGRDFGHERDYSENIATVIDQEVSDLISAQYTPRQRCNIGSPSAYGCNR